MTSIRKDKKQKPEPIVMNREQRRAFKKKHKIDPLMLGIQKGKTINYKENEKNTL